MCLSVYVLSCSTNIFRFIPLPPDATLKQDSHFFFMVKNRCSARCLCAILNFILLYKKFMNTYDAILKQKEISIKKSLVLFFITTYII